MNLDSPSPPVSSAVTLLVDTLRGMGIVVSPSIAARILGEQAQASLVTGEPSSGQGTVVPGDGASLSDVKGMDSGVGRSSLGLGVGVDVPVVPGMGSTSAPFNVVGCR